MSFVYRKLYWIDGENISMANMDGTNHTLLYSNQKGPVGERPVGMLDVYLSFCQSKTGHYSAAGCDLLLCLLLPVAGLSIDFDTEQLYWINSVNGSINRCKLDGSGLEIIESVKLVKATALAIMGEEASASFVQISES